MDPCRLGDFKVGNFRVGSVRDDWDRALKQFENLAVCDVTLYSLGLGARDSTTGWYAKRFTESIITGILVTKSTTQIAHALGTYVRTDALFITSEVVEEGDEIKTTSDLYYQVKAVRFIYFGKSFNRRECDLTFLPLK